jgi:ATP-dependent RNA helicase DeaD
MPNGNNTMTTFASFDLSPALARGVADLGFTEPTPVQAKVIPLLLKQGRDLVVLAQTGTGKTAAFGLPLLHGLDAKRSDTQGLILCPTRELCLQISRDLADFGKHAPHLRILAVYGGTSIGLQMRELRRGVHVIVATPGRMNDLMRRGGVKLETVSQVVLDEADEMLDMGFEEDLTTILEQVPETARTLLFSATMPKSVAAMAGKYLNDPEEILVGRRNAGADQIAHECYTVHARDRYPALKRIVDTRPGFYGIVFCRTRVETQEVSGHLVADGYSADALHGDLSQDQRDRVMANFRRRHIQILVATDVASRGLDVDDLTHVIHYDLPNDPDVYTHRSGRTGRAGKSGTSIVLVHLREHYKVRAIERLLNRQFQNKRVPTGREVCEVRLAELLEQVKKIDLSEGALAPYRATMDRLLADVPADELVQRLVLHSFGRFLSYYRDAPDLNVSSHGPGPRHERRMDRPDRPGHHERRDPRPPPPGLVRVRLNIGQRNELTPSDLIALVNRATHGPMLKVGRIHIMEQSTVFEVDAAGARKLLPNLCQAVFNERPVRAVAEGEGGGGPREREFRGPPRGPRPPFHKRRPPPRQNMETA